MDRALILDPADSVATALVDLIPGEVVAGVAIVEAVPRGHKLALRAVAAGEAVMKFGQPIGRATLAIAAGAHVHSHNLATGLTGELAYRFAGGLAPVATAPDARSFQGYHRADGRVGTRNEIWILPTVGCVARTAERIARAAAPAVAGLVDGVHAFTHPFGCSQLGDDLAATRAVLASLACHPNAGGVLLLGLGCEENQLDALLASVPPERRGAIRMVGAQLSDDEEAAGVAAVIDLARAATLPRTTAGLDRLVLGLKCGGSDGLSGLTANPLVGRVADLVTGAGGSAVLTEIPEMFGAEALLLGRTANAGVFERLAALLNAFKRHYLDHGLPVSENPSPGNVAGGITTLEEKSLGAVQKGGRGTIVDVLDYAARVRIQGLSVLESPGNDAVSATALTAAGATCLLFTTGRGTPLGFPAPTVKIASNAALAARKPGWIDFDASTVLTDGFDRAAAALLDRVLAVASGAETAAERLGEREIALWKRGVTL